MEHIEPIITKVFMSGNSQAVRIPKELRVSTSELEMFKIGGDLVLREPAKKRGLAEWLTEHYAKGDLMPSNFMEGVVDLPPEPFSFDE